MRPIRSSLVAVTLLVGAVVVDADPVAPAPPVIVEIEPRGRPGSFGGVEFTVWVTCGPLPGTPDFREGHAGAAQDRTGAAAEGGLSPDVTCDGDRRRYVAGMSPITEAGFKRGPAGANAAVIACNTVGDGQVCTSGSAARRIVIAGRST